MCWTSYDDLPGVVLEEQTRTARKAHVCVECGRTIEPGEQYVYESGIWDGEFCSYKTCRHCDAARQWLGVQCGGWVYGQVLNDLLDHWREYPENRTLWLGRVIVGMRRQWRGLQPLPAPLLTAAGGAA